MRAQANRATRGLAIALVLLSCTPAIVRTDATPETAGRLAWDRLTGLGSFRFRIRYRSDSPISLHADFNGTWQSPDREAWSGTWRRGRVSTRTRLVGAGESQFEKTDNGWRRSPRGTETRVVEQARAVMQGETLAYAGESGRAFVYVFRGIVPLLDPMRQRRLQGTMLVSRGSGLPELVRCSDETGSSEWEVRFSGFDRAGDVRVPFITAVRATVAPGAALSRAQAGAALRTIKERLRALGWAFETGRARGGTGLRFDQDLLRSHLELAVSRGSVELWSARAAGAGEAGDSVLAVAGDVARRVALRARVGANVELGAAADLSLPFDPALVVPAPSLDTASDRLALLLDGACIGTAVPDAEGAGRFRDLGGEQFVRTVAVLAGRAPLTTGYRVVDYRRN